MAVIASQNMLLRYFALGYKVFVTYQKTDRHHYPEAPLPAIKYTIKKKCFWLFCIHGVTSNTSGDVDGDVELENLQDRVKLSTKCYDPSVYIRLFLAPGQCSPVSISAVRKVVMAEIWSPPWCLHSPDTGEDEDRKRERGKHRERITYSCSTTTQSTLRLSASGHVHNILWLKLRLRLCVDEWGADIEDLHNMFKACYLRLTFVSVHSNRTFTSDKCSRKERD